MTFTPSKYQQAIFDEIAHGTGNLAIDAVAGSGKTVTIIQAMQYIPKGKRVAFVAFNRHIVEEMQRRVPAGVDVMTTHQLGIKCLRDAGYRIKIDKKKLDNHIDAAMSGYSRWTLYEMRSYIRKIIGFLKNTGQAPTEDNIDLIMANYNMETPLNVLPNIEYDKYREHGPKGVSQYYRTDLNRALSKNQQIIPYSEYTELIAEIYNSTTADTSCIDFDDMLHLPYVLGLKLEYYDYVMGDEVQDYNAVQAWLTKNAVNSTGRVVVVGDPFQSMYGFRGAGVNSMAELIRTLNATVLPLSVTYRCPTTHVELARGIVGHLEAAEGAKEGSVTEVSYDDAVSRVKPGDLVICRYNAPIIRMCLELIVTGRKATVRGRDVAAMLSGMIKKFEVRTSAELVRAAEAWYEAMKQQCEEQNTDSKPYHDRYETITALVYGLPKIKTVEGLLNYLDTLYSEEGPEGEAIVLSTVHGAKGLEAETIYILFPESMPHRHKSQQDWEMQQEMNILYVALTRSKSTIYMVRKDD